MHKVNFSLFIILFLQLFLFEITSANENLAVEISDVWISEAPPTVSVLAAYGTINNLSQEPVALVSASSPDFSRIEIHRSVIENEMVSMHKQYSIIIPARKSLKLSPGDYHLMLFDPVKPFRAGDKTEVNFIFSDNKEITVEANVEKRNSDNHSHHHHH